MPYELACHSNFSFLCGASEPEALVEEAAPLRLDAIAITDHDGTYGVVRLAEAAKDIGVATVFGTELSVGLSAPQTAVQDLEGERVLSVGPFAGGVPAAVPGGYRRPVAVAVRRVDRFTTGTRS